MEYQDDHVYKASSLERRIKNPGRYRLMPASSVHCLALQPQGLGFKSMLKTLRVLAKIRWTLEWEILSSLHRGCECNNVDGNLRFVSLGETEPP